MVMQPVRLLFGGQFSPTGARWDSRFCGLNTVRPSRGAPAVWDTWLSRRVRRKKRVESLDWPRAFRRGCLLFAYFGGSFLACVVSNVFLLFGAALAPLDPFGIFWMDLGLPFGTLWPSFRYAVRCFIVLLPSFFSIFVYSSTRPAVRIIAIR